MSRATGMRVWGVAAVSGACLGAGCAAHNPPKPTPTVPGHFAAVSSNELTGVWVEYWAPAGKADSQRFAFLQDGRFVWQAALSGQPPAEGPARKGGHYQVERNVKDGQTDQAGTLVLSVESDEQRACTGTCAESDAGMRRVDYTPARLERYELGECAPNEEAKEVDASYACLAMAGRAFWRQSRSETDAQALLWPQAVAAP